MAATHRTVAQLGSAQPDGADVALSSQEAAAVEAEWAANPPPTAQQWLDALRAKAVALLAAEQAEDARLMRAVVLTTLDEINLLRQWIMDFKAAVAAATSLANLQTRVAALSAMPQRTPSQVRRAIDNKITAGDADS